MKKVNTPQNVAHLFANKVQEEARSQGNFYFNHNTIYSYGSHFPIATHYNDVLLFTLRTYSNTTQKHIGLVRSAASHLPKIFCAYPDNAARGLHVENIEWWIKKVKSITKNILNARKPEIYIAQIAQEITNATEYVNFFKIKLTKEQKKILTLADTNEYKAALQKEKEAKELFEKNILTSGKKLFDKSINAWVNYNEKEFREKLTNRQKNLLNAYMNLQNANEVFLRSNGSEVETTKGVKLPVDVAKRYYNWFIKIAPNGCENCNYKILDYDVKEANNKHLVVGCHDIDINVINQLAARLNW